MSPTNHSPIRPRIAGKQPKKPKEIKKLQLQAQNESKMMFASIGIKTPTSSVFTPLS